MLRPLFTKSISALLIVGIGALVGGMMPVGAPVPAADGSVVAVAAEADACAKAVYPYLPAECLTRADGQPVEEVRWVTTETRLADNVSALTTRPVLQ